MMSCEKPQIPQFYAGRSVFITGATGFVGQVLVERLLYTCPDIERLFLLLREKKNCGPMQRLRLLKDSPVFDNVRQKNPSQLEKLTVVSGDITKPQLGLQQESIDLLQNVSVVFHSAATIKFEEPFATAVEQNIKPVTKIMELCDNLPNMEAFVYVSTAYSNAELTVVEERVYSPPVPLKNHLALVDNATPEQLSNITQECIAPKPNTYTYSKAMAEVVVQEHTGRTYSAAIFRPTIVVSAMRHPHAGWVQGLNGPSGVVASAGKGLLHVLHARGSARADMLPVDIAVDTLIAVAWETATDRIPEVRVYNCSSSENPTTWSQFEDGIRRNMREHPFDNAFWWPCGSSIENWFVYKILEFLLHTMPLYIAEYVMLLLGTKSRINMITLNSRLQGMNSVLAFFSKREWKFDTRNVQMLRRRLTPQDAAIYNLDPNTIDWNEHYKNFVKGVRKYLLKERDEDIEKAKHHMRKLYFLHLTVLVVFIFLILRTVMQLTNTQKVIWSIGGLIDALLY
ncbi:unnamed protein product [Diatraea saccharalis]|uniref:Fatty acyl-CoA reductase n=1 Tax=Diatraea saccharalis TaxID=40085 RepID=A0A9N9RDY1_9NEOP|nr:unnamed protein product [Diatraea saccharalis]